MIFRPLFFFLVIGGALFGAASFAQCQRPKGEWIGELGAFKAVGLAVGGLNLKSEKMYPLAQKMSHLGIRTFVLRLKGHAESYDELAQTDLRDWRSEIDEALCYLKSQNLNRPIVGMGFSLGGGLLFDYVLRGMPQGDLLKIFTLAPVIATSWAQDFGSLFFVLPNHWGIPGLNRLEYRVHKSTPLKAYKVGYQLARENQKNMKPLPLSAVVILTKGDELIPYREAREVLERNGVKVVDVDNSRTKNNRFKHNLIDGQVSAPGVFSQIEKELNLFFNFE